MSGGCTHGGSSMGSFSDFLELELLDHVFGAATYTPPVTLYVALFTAAPGDSGGGTEVTGGTYARVAVTNNKTNWSDAAGGALFNDVDVQFPTATASWGTVTHFAIFDDSVAGNQIGWGALTESRLINSGDTPKFLPGALPISLD